MQIPDREYWEKRFEALEAAVHKQGLATYGDIEKQYLQAMNELDTVLAAWFQKFMQENNVTFTEAKKMLQGKDLAEFRLTIDQYIAKAKEQNLSESWQRKLNNASIRVHVSRLEAILLQLQQYLEVLFNNQLDTLDAAMRSRYTDSYYETAFTIQHGFGIGHSFNQVDTNKLDMLMAKPWAADGKNFSDRVWEHKNKLVAILDQEMTQAVIRGDDYRRATNNIARRMNVSKGAAGRLVMTESAFFATKAQQDCFKELDVEQYEFIATLDSRTSDICRHMDGKVFKVSDIKPGTTAPPLHCHCRSCTAPYFDDAEDAERVARGKDGKTYKVPGDITYKEWEKLNEAQNRPVIDYPNNAQSYKSVQLGEEAKIMLRGKPIKANRVNSAYFDTYVSKGINLKPKELHTVQNIIAKAIKMVKGTSSMQPPKICIVSKEKIMATAAYLARNNTLYVSPGGLFENAPYFAKSDNKYSTAVHEMLHWKDAQEYIKQYGAITDQGKYRTYLCKKYKTRLDTLGINRYNVIKVSRYAFDSYQMGKFDEVFTEYRVMQIIKGD